MHAYVIRFHTYLPHYSLRTRHFFIVSIVAEFAYCRKVFESIREREVLDGST
jgi:hypothetical protein